MKSLIAMVAFAVVFLAQALSAQPADRGPVWVQIEAHPSLQTARQRAQAYAGKLTDVAGFSLGGNWYGILLGPYRRDDAEALLRTLRAEQRIPQDAFIAFSSGLGQQFWPVGTNSADRNAAPIPNDTGTPAVTPATPAPAAADETPAEARRSERALGAGQRKALQVALRAAGFYGAAIDGAFGPGTREAMKRWQDVNGFTPTGILTTLQRQVLLDQYNAPLISVGMALVRDRQAGIEMMIPAGVVGFARYEPPFAHYDPTGDLGARVLLISQPGDQITLSALYDIMQTLEIVPPDGPRQRGEDHFTLEGRGNGIVSYTEARLQGGQIKGFSLIWPMGDEDRRKRVLDEMKAGFTRIEGVLDPATGTGGEQRIDLVSGLEVRRPLLSRSGFYVDGDGTVVTTAEAVQNCARITLDQNYQARLVSADETLGVAVLRPLEPLAPMSVARLRAGTPRLHSEVAVAGYSYEGVLGAPTLTFGTLADIRGLHGETGLARLTLVAQPGDAGGPVLDTGGAVLGMLLPPANSGQQLPGDVRFVANAGAILDVLALAGIGTAGAPEEPDTAAKTAARDLSPNEFNRVATGMTVLVSCWG